MFSCFSASYYSKIFVSLFYILFNFTQNSTFIYLFFSSHFISSNGYGVLNKDFMNNIEENAFNCLFTTENLESSRRWFLCKIIYHLSSNTVITIHSLKRRFLFKFKSRPIINFQNETWGSVYFFPPMFLYLILSNKRIVRTVAQARALLGLYLFN